jgi:SAM-dependent methyltransferase
MPDVFGRIMMDAALGEDAIHIIEREDGYEDEYKGSQYVEPFDEWGEPEKNAITQVKGRVLDVGCGAGRVAVYLQEMGFDVVGIDISQGAVEASHLRGFGQAQVMSADDLDFPDGCFDTVILFGGNFGILGEDDKIVKMLKDLHRITSDDAVILASSRDVTHTDTPKHLAYHELNRKRGFPVGRIRLRLSYKGEKTDWQLLRFADSEEMETMAAKAGWKLEETLGPPNAYVGVLRKA